MTFRHKTIKKQSGFISHTVLVGVVVVATIAFVGVLVWNHQKDNDSKADNTATVKQAKTPSKKATPSLIPVSTADGKVTVSLPEGWHVVAGSDNADGKQVISNNTNTQVCKGGICGVAGCMSVDDTVACIYDAEFQPKELDPTTDQKWRLTVEKSNWTIEQASENLLGILNSDNIVEKSSDPINSYEAYYVKVKINGGSVGDYVDTHYFIANKGYLVHFYNREQYNVNSGGWDNSKYASDFATIAKSIKLNF